MRRMHCVWFCLLSYFGAIQNSHAEIGYVTDQLVLGVRSEKSSAKPFQSIVSGTEVEIIAREGKYTLVKLASGKKGWVRTGYLVKEKPALAIMPELTQRQASLSSEVSQTKQQLTTTQQRLHALQQTAADKSEQLTERELQLQNLQTQYNHLRDKIGDLKNPVSVNWLVVTTILAFILGIYISYKVVDGKIRKRYYGYRIY